MTKENVTALADDVSSAIVNSHDYGIGLMMQHADLDKMVFIPGAIFEQMMQQWLDVVYDGMASVQVDAMVN